MIIRVYRFAAPPGQLIKLDFRNVFHIEESPGCEFDYLEVSGQSARKHIFEPSGLLMLFNYSTPLC